MDSMMEYITDVSHMEYNHIDMAVPPRSQGRAGPCAAIPPHIFSRTYFFLCAWATRPPESRERALRTRALSGGVTKAAIFHRDEP